MPELRASDFQVHEDVRRAETLPPAAFVDPAFLERELATLFRRHWLLVPERTAAELRDDDRSLAQMVQRRGARAPFALLDRPLFLQRDWDGTLRAFPNVCTHAWHTLVQGPGRERVITCPQHGRQFDCAGRFASHPGFEGIAPRPSDHLQAHPTATWGEFLFTCLGEPPAPFEDVMAPVTASLGTLPLAELERKPLAGEVRELAGNWKQHAWNYLDSLHIPYIHRKPGGLADAVELDSYRTELHGDSVLQWAFAREPEHGFPAKALPAPFRAPGKRVFALWWFVFPGLALNFYPWGLSVNAYFPVPREPQRTLFLWYHHVWDEAKYARRDQVWKMQEVDDEDVDALQQVGRGVASGLAPRGRFAPAKEQGPHWFHRRVFEAVFEK